MTGEKSARSSRIASTIKFHAYTRPPRFRFFDRRSKRRRLETERATEGLIYALHTLLAGFHRKQGGLIFTATRRLSFSHNDSTSTVSHHPLMNKISLLPNLPCYLPSFDRKHPFLCTFSPLDHLDPVPTSKLVLEINRPRDPRDDSTMHNS